MFGDLFNIFRISNKEEKDTLVDILAVAIYADQLVRQEEIDMALLAMAKFFDGEDADYMSKKLQAELDGFGADIKKFEAKKERVVNYILAEERKDIALLMKKIFQADHEVSKGEQQLLQRLNKLI